MAAFKLGPKSKPAELLAALGQRLQTYQDRDYVYIPRKKKLVPHRTATRDYRCDCGGGLVTRMVNGEWRTVCSVDDGHEQSRFVTQAGYQAKRHRELVREGGN